MSSKRRIWRESLKNECNSISSDDVMTVADETENDNNKKITILSEKIYKKINGKLIEILNTNNSVSEETKDTQQLNAVDEPTTPRHLSITHSVDKITPTFRNPKIFLAETKQILDKISPAEKNPVDGISNCSNINCSVNDNDNLLSIDSDLNSSECGLKNKQKRVSDSDESFIEESPELRSGSRFARKRLKFCSTKYPSNNDNNVEDPRAYFFDSSRQTQTDKNISNSDYDYSYPSCLEERAQMTVEIEIEQVSELEINKLQNEESSCCSNFSDSIDVSTKRKNRDTGRIIYGQIDDRISDETDKEQLIFQVEAKIENVSSQKGIQRSSTSTVDKVIVKHNISDEIELENDFDNQDDLICIQKNTHSISDLEEEKAKKTIKKSKIQENLNTLRDWKLRTGSRRVSNGSTENRNLEKQLNIIKSNRPQRKVKFDKSYLDFMEDDLEQLLLDEAFPSDGATDWSSESETSSEIEDCKKERNNKEKKKKINKEKKKKKSNKENICNDLETRKELLKKKKLKKETEKENKTNKRKGQAYLNKKGEEVPAKSMKPNPCIGKNCGNGCGSVSEQKREQLFTYFWSLGSYERRKDWIAKCAIRKTVKNLSKTSTPTRSCTYEYYINEGEGRRKVCQKYLICTLDVTQRFILYTLEETVDGFAKKDGRGKFGGHNKTPDSVLDYAKEFIMSLPLVPSHYCRKDSARLYLPQEFRNISNLYRIYAEHCNSNDIAGTISFKVFNKWFSDNFNIGFHRPKKDKCMICSNNNNENTEEKEKILKHIEEKNASYERFKCHQELHKKNKSILCCSFDMQKVLNTPHGNDMRLYYSRKLSVYNFTIYESVTRAGHCYVWTEADAHRGANEISTCIFDFIVNDVDARISIKTLLLYADSCYGQNKNKTVLSMLRYALSQCINLNKIQVNYLIPGHTFMPVDSMHATIENFVKKSTVWAPSQWPTLFQFARQIPAQYKVKVLKGHDFMGFDDILNNTFKKTQKIYISKVCVATFNKQKPNLMKIKYSMLQETPEEIPLSKLCKKVALKTKLYPVRLPISKAKYMDLKKLIDKKVMPSVYASEYLNLSSNNKVIDRLDQTDEEDDIIENSGNNN